MVRNHEGSGNPPAIVSDYTAARHPFTGRPAIKPTKTDREKSCQRHEAQASIWVPLACSGIPVQRGASSVCRRRGSSFLAASSRSIYAYVLIPCHFARLSRPIPGRTINPLASCRSFLWRSTVDQIVAVGHIAQLASD
jgi:hypothetical protein